MERVLAWMIVFGAAIVPAFFTAIPTWLRVVICISGTTAVLVARTSGWLAGRDSIQRIAWEPDGRWFLSTAQRTWEAELDRDTRISSAVLLLRWRTTDSRPRSTSVLLLPGDLPRGEFRRLVVRLRIEGARRPVTAESLLA
jgi:hypothetical protein